MFSTLHFPIRLTVLGKALVGGAAGTAMMAAGIAASPAALAASGISAAPATAAAHAKPAHVKAGTVRDHRADRRAKIEAYLDASAQVLKMSPSDLRQALKSGRSLEEIASEHGYASKPAFTEAVVKAVKPLLDADVDSKKLTRAEADHFLDRLSHGKLPFWNRTHAPKK